MRNLKRALSLALASVMLLGMMLMCGKVTHKNLNRQQPIIPKKS